jgi:TonB family protein
MARKRTKQTSIGLLRVLGAFLFVSCLSAQEVRDTIGPIENQATTATPENPIPRRSFSVAPVYPAEAAAVDGAGAVSLVVTIDETGRVVEIRKARDPFVIRPQSHLASANSRNARFGSFTTPSNSAEARAVGEAFMRESAAALRRWRYDPPANAPLAFTVTFSFRQGAEVTSTQSAAISPSSAPPTTNPNQSVSVGAPIRSPLRTKMVQPRYPPEAVAAKVEGIVILEAWIGIDGRVIDAKVLRSVPLLDQAAVDAVRQWEYAPTMLNGAPVPVITTVTVTFNLEPGVPPAPPLK